MNLIDIIRNDIFIKKMFPNGVEYIYIPKIDISTFNVGHSNFFIHIKDKPAVDINRQGAWGVDYTTLVLNLSANVTNLKIENLTKFDYEKINIIRKGEYFFITQKNENFSLEFTMYGKMFFQRVSGSYLEDDDDELIL